MSSLIYELYEIIVNFSPSLKKLCLKYKDIIIKHSQQIYHNLSILIFSSNTIIFARTKLFYPREQKNLNSSPLSYVFTFLGQVSTFLTTTKILDSIFTHYTRGFGIKGITYIFYFSDFSKVFFKFLPLKLQIP